MGTFIYYLIMIATTLIVIALLVALAAAKSSPLVNYEARHSLKNAKIAEKAARRIVNGFKKTSVNAKQTRQEPQKCGSGELISEVNFDNLNVGDYVAANVAEIATWTYEGDSTGEDALVSDDVGSNSAKLAWDGAESQSDLLYLLGNRNRGAYRVCFDLYIPEGHNGYFNLQISEATETWAYDTLFLEDGSMLLYNGYLALDLVETDATYPQGEWFHVTVEVNLDDNLLKFSVNNQVVLEDAYFKPRSTDQYSYNYEYDSQCPAFEYPLLFKQLGAVNFYALEAAETSTFYADNLRYEQI